MTKKSLEQRAKELFATGEYTIKEALEMAALEEKGASEDVPELLKKIFRVKE